MAVVYETWVAASFHGAKGGTSTNPMVVDCYRQSDPDGPTRRFVVKYHNATVQEYRLAYEIIGAWVANRCGVETPPAALVELNHAFLTATRESREQVGVYAKPQTAVGTTLLRGLQPWVPGSPVRGAHRAQAAKIYATDLLIQHIDRIASNPNCGLHRGRIVAYDYEMSCDFLHHTPPHAPWRLSLSDVARDHLFRSTLKRRRPDWGEFATRLQTLRRGDFDQLERALPDAWHQEVREIADHVMAAVERADWIPGELNGSLS